MDFNSLLAHAADHRAMGWQDGSQARGGRMETPSRSWRVVLTVIGSVAVLVLDAVTPLGLAVWLLQVVLVWIATLWASRRQIIAVAAVCATFIVLGFWLSPKNGRVTWVDQSNVILGLGTVSVLTHSCLRRMAT